MVMPEFEPTESAPGPTLQDNLLLALKATNQKNPVASSRIENEDPGERWREEREVHTDVRKHS